MSVIYGKRGVVEMAELVAFKVQEINIAWSWEGAAVSRDPSSNSLDFDDDL